jgi:hypothetical protein
MTPLLESVLARVPERHAVDAGVPASISIAE